MLTSRFLTFSLVFCISLWGVISCNDPNPQLPLYEEEIRILTEVMLIESVLQDFNADAKDSLIDANYDLLYDRYGISEEDLQELRHRFSEDPTLWTRAADSIEVRLKAGRADFETLLNPELN